MGTCLPWALAPSCEVLQSLLPQQPECSSLKYLCDQGAPLLNFQRSWDKSQHPGRGLKALSPRAGVCASVVCSSLLSVSPSPPLSLLGRCRHKACSSRIHFSWLSMQLPCLPLQNSPPVCLRGTSPDPRGAAWPLSGLEWEGKGQGTACVAGWRGEITVT